MKVLLVTGIYPPQVGGPAAQTRRLAQGLLARGVGAVVVTAGPDRASGVEDGVPVRRLGTGTGRGPLARAARWASLRRQLAAVLDAERPTVVHTQTAAGPLALLAGMAARGRGIPSVLKYTADLTWEKTNLDRPFDAAGGGGSPADRARLWALARFQRLLFSRYDRVWATTPPFAARLTESVGVPPARVALAPNFVDLAPFRAAGAARADAEGPLRLLTVARLNPLKGVDVVLRALAALDAPARLRVVGAGEPAYEARLRALAAELGVAGRVEFAGAVPNEALAAEYARADLFVLGSRYEAFGIALAEAMAAGLPVVATAVGGVPHVVEDGVAGLLVPPENPGALAAAVAALAADAPRRAAMGRAAARAAEAYGIDAGIDALLRIYREAAAAPRAPRGAAVPAWGAE